MRTRLRTRLSARLAVRHYHLSLQLFQFSCLQLLHLSFYIWRRAWCFYYEDQTVQKKSDVTDTLKTHHPQNAS